MAAPSLELSSFRRTFLLLVLLVVLPSAALSGFGVLAIINERAAVQKRLAAAWGGRLETVSAKLRSALRNSVGTPEDGELAVWSQTGIKLSDQGFSVRAGKIETRDGDLRTALAAVVSELDRLPPERLEFLSVPYQKDSFLLAARQEGAIVKGARIFLPAVDKLVDELSAEAVAGERVRFEARTVQRGVPDGLVNKLVSGVVGARDAALTQQPLAERELPEPFHALKLVALPIGVDPVSSASTRNRAIYGTLLGIFYLTLALGVFYTGRALYREAKISRLKTDFVSLVSHELRTPLTSIRMFIDTLSLGRVRDPVQTQEVLSLLAKETERLSDLIERVLDWARMESGGRVYKLDWIPVQALLDSSIAAFRVQRHDSPMNLACELAPNLPPIHVDREALAGALLNLLQNAFKYGGADKRIWVRARPEGKGIAIDVEDDGIGIPPRERKRVFERFYRVDNLLTRKTEGSGLGLALASRIVEAHGGKLSLRSEVGKGSCFTIHLPVSAAPRTGGAA